ncbi:MAG: hypothetical protein LBN21_12990 [Treponema sp.]|jgi:hypothetical protein|nr:hypothetical protein [Treponema sp.]
MTIEVDKALRMLSALRDRVLEKYTAEDREALQRRLIIKPVEQPPVYSAFRSFEDVASLEALLKKPTLTKLDQHDLLFYLTTLQAVLYIFEGAACQWNSGEELLDLCGKKLNHWMQNEPGWPFPDHAPVC